MPTETSRGVPLPTRRGLWGVNSVAPRIQGVKSLEAFWNDGKMMGKIPSRQCMLVVKKK